MRVTQQLMADSLNQHLGASLRRLYQESRKIATGKRIQYPSDDPVAMEASLRLGSVVSQMEQYLKNVADALSWLDITESSLGQIGEGLHRARELAVRAANGPLSPGDRADIAKEIAQIADDLVSIGNTRFGDRYIFGGRRTQSPPFVRNGEYQYVGSPQGGQVVYEIGPGLTLSLGVTGDAAIMPAVEALVALEKALLSDDFDGTVEALSLIDAAFETVLRWRSEIGARMSRLELTEARYEQDLINLRGLLSDKEDIDYAESIMRLKQEESLYQAALAATARIIQPSLIDFLR